MRAVILASVMGLLSVPPTQAENRLFVIANNADGYGVDRCLATGASCGTALASAYCRAQDFARAVSFRKMERTELAMLASAPACRGSCDDFVAIECGR
jgi:uncharacterized DUF497 family protein